MKKPYFCYKEIEIYNIFTSHFYLNLASLSTLHIYQYDIIVLLLYGLPEYHAHTFKIRKLISSRHLFTSSISFEWEEKLSVSRQTLIYAQNILVYRLFKELCRHHFPYICCTVLLYTISEICCAAHFHDHNRVH